MEEYKGIIQEITYYNEQTGYIVCSMLIERTTVTVVGKVVMAQVGEILKFQGSWTSHPNYGEQLKISSYEKIMPSSVKQIEEYLASGVLEGVGNKLAKKIVKKFGEKTLDVINFEPDKLTFIKGVSKHKAHLISEAFQEKIRINELCEFFNGYKIPSNVVMKIYSKLYPNCLETVKQNPYILTNEDFGVGFKLVDDLAIDVGVDIFSKERIKSAIMYVLNEASLNGNTYLAVFDIYKKVIALTKVDKQTVQTGIIDLRSQGEVVIEQLEKNLNGDIKEDSRIFLFSHYESEKYIAYKLTELSKSRFRFEEERFNSFLERFEEEQGISFADNQMLAIKKCLKTGVTVITGGPGTGKTTIIKAIIDWFEEDKRIVMLTAPTGRAAKRMSESTGRRAKTIHRLLEVEFDLDMGKVIFFRNEKDPLNADVIIVDEMSMVDINIMSALLKAIELHAKVVLVGDTDQLPSVGPGAVLKDIINSKKVETVRLNQIFRQASQSMIVLNAHRINSKKFPYYNAKDSDFYFVRENNQDDALKTVADLYSTRLPNYYGFLPMKDIQIITPTRKGKLGVMELNKVLQKVVNPSSPEKAEKKLFDITFREGDRVMQIKNNYNIEWINYSYKLDGEKTCGKGVFNGDMGVITHVEKDGSFVSVIFDDEKQVDYDLASLEQLEHAYAITVHKSQGSEFPAVVIPVMDGPSVLYTKNLFYTAVTRAKSLVVLVGLEKVIQKMVSNDLKSLRLSALKTRLETDVLDVENDI